MLHYYSRFVEQYNKNYETSAFFTKYNTFVSNLNNIIAHNAKPNASYTMAVNEFADMTFEEFSSKLGLKPIKASYARSLNTAKFSRKISNGAKDWRADGAVNKMKNQGQCGSCWAFSANAAIEGSVQISTGKLLDLAESQLVDCAGDFGNYGCNGGLMDSAFEYVLSNGGICATSEYPYKAVDGTCKQCKNVASISGYKNVKENDEADLTSAIDQTVVAVAVEANSNFQFYSSGVFNGPCGTALNHGIAAVGYDLNVAKPYYIVRNSWGTSWGEGGYIRMATGENLCGIAAMASYVQA